MAEITYNEEVTAESLNNLAVDLGDTTFKYFENNKPYAVEELNQITSDLVSSGVLRTGENGALGCEAVLANNKIYVQAGVIVFESGAKIRITEPVEIGLVAGTFIYALYDSTTGRASIEVSESTPSGDYVLLAQVNADGVITDRRCCCVSKAITAADAKNVYKEFEVVIEAGTEYAYVDMGSNSFSYVFLKGVKRITISSDTENTYVASGNNAKLLEEGNEIDMWIAYEEMDGTAHVNFKQEGQRLGVAVWDYPGDYVYNKSVVTFMVM